MHGLSLLSAAILVTAAFAADLRWQRVPNIWIMAGWAWGLLCQYSVDGWGGMADFFAGATVPAVCLFPLFRFRMLGPGDIKLLSVLGGLLGRPAAIYLIFISFFLGGVLSLGLLIASGTLLFRFRYFTDHFKTYVKERRPRPYYRTGDRVENIHFTLPIALGVFLYVGGIC